MGKVVVDLSTSFGRLHRPSLYPTEEGPRRTPGDISADFLVMRQRVTSPWAYAICPKHAASTKRSVGVLSTYSRL